MTKKIKGTLPGIENRLYNKIDEDLSLFNVAVELLHNGLEHGGANGFCFHYYTDDKNTPCLQVFNNGKPMQKNIFDNLISKYIVHDTTNSIPSINGDFISLTGCGLKDSCLFLAILDGKTKITITNYYEDGTTLSWSWVIDKKRPENGYYYEEPILGTYNIMEHSPGVEILAQNCKKISEPEFEDSILKVSRVLSDEILESKKIVQYQYEQNEKKILPLEDPLNLKNFPGDIYKAKPDFYFTEKYTYKIVEKVFVNKNNENDKINIRLLTQYLNPSTKKRQKSISLSESSGLYPMKSGMYIEMGGNVQKHFSYPGNTGHGLQRIQQVIFFTDKNEKIYHITSTKMNGIPSLRYNVTLLDYVCVDDDTLNIYDFISGEYNYFFLFHKKYIESVILYQNNDFETYKDSLKEDLYKFDENKNLGTIRKKLSKKRNIKNIDISEFQPVIVPNSVPSYCLNRKDQIVKREFNEIGDWSCQINTTAINGDLNLMPIEFILSVGFDTLQSIVSPEQFQEIAKQWANNLNECISKSKFIR